MGQFVVGLPERFGIIRFRDVSFWQKMYFAHNIGPRCVQKSTPRTILETFSIPFWIILTRAFIWKHQNWPKILKLDPTRPEKFEKIGWGHPRIILLEATTVAFWACSKSWWRRSCSEADLHWQDAASSDRPLYQTRWEAKERMGGYGSQGGTNSDPQSNGNNLEP